MQVGVLFSKLQVIFSIERWQQLLDLAKLRGNCIQVFDLRLHKREFVVERDQIDNCLIFLYVLLDAIDLVRIFVHFRLMSLGSLDEKSVIPSLIYLISFSEYYVIGPMSFSIACTRNYKWER